MFKQFQLLTVCLFAILLTGCGDTSGTKRAIIVNSLEDIESPRKGVTTIRSALKSAVSGQTISFDQNLDGGIIRLSIIGESHSILKGEVMGMREEPSGPVSYLTGYFDRDYGRSSLYVKKDIIIDASSLPSGITFEWADDNPLNARVLAVYGSLTLNNVNITGGKSVAEDISALDPDQLWTLARGGGLAVWGTANLINCTFYNNHCTGDFDSSRDRGAFGGGIYADSIVMTGCVVSGNTVSGAGAAGGGVYSVGGVVPAGPDSILQQSVITGNRISGLFTYGGGVYSDGGGIGNNKKLTLNNCTIAENLVEPVSSLPSFLQSIGYWRGGGVYVSNGYLTITASTIADNQVYGYPRVDSLGKPNLAGGVAATIGNAHAVEEMVIGQSIVAGNTVFEQSLIDGTVTNSYDHDIFTGSLFYFRSLGYNRIGIIDFSQILVPVGEANWQSLCRKHFPKTGDRVNINIADVLDLENGIYYSDTILSEGVGSSSPAILYYEPGGSALDQIPQGSYSVESTYAEYTINAVPNDFLSIILERIESRYTLENFAAEVTAEFETFLQSVDTDDETAGNQPYTTPAGTPVLTLADTLWHGPSATWPKEVANYPYIEFWHRLDAALAQQTTVTGMGPELLGDAEWNTLFLSGSLDENNQITMDITSKTVSVEGVPADQRTLPRPVNLKSDIGAIETQ